MDLPSALVAAFSPSPDCLLDHARRDIDDSMLTTIARADYGHMAGEMLAELQPIRDMGTIPAPMHWQLAEVLCLTRWCNPEKPDVPPFEPGPTGRPGHQTRLFACAVLLRGSAMSGNEHRDGSADSTLAQCLVSAKVLGVEMSDAAARFLTWRIPRMERGSEQLLFAVGLLILAIRLRSNRIAEPVLASIAEWVLAEELLYRKGHHSDPADPLPSAFSVQSGYWRPLTTELSEEAAAIRADGIRSNIQLCRLLLEPGWNTEA
jgi:hypothetical protein